MSPNSRKTRKREQAHQLLLSPARRPLVVWLLMQNRAPSAQRHEAARHPGNRAHSRSVEIRPSSRSGSRLGTVRPLIVEQDVLIRFDQQNRRIAEMLSDPLRADQHLTRCTLAFALMFGSISVMFRLLQLSENRHAFKFGFDMRCQPRAHFFKGNALHDWVEEACHDRALGVLARHAARHQVEDRLIFQTPDRSRVRAAYIIRLDLRKAWNPGRRASQLSTRLRLA